MTREEAKRILYVFRAVILVDASHIEAFDIAMKALEQEPCEDAISRQAVLNYIRDNYRRWFINDDAFTQCVNGIKDIVSVTPQPKMGCEGCTYEKTGNNSTYPCSHCGRCYTDKYKAERKEEE